MFPLYLSNNTHSYFLTKKKKKKKRYCMAMTFSLWAFKCWWIEDVATE